MGGFWQIHDRVSDTVVLSGVEQLREQRIFVWVSLHSYTRKNNYTLWTISWSTVWTLSYSHPNWTGVSPSGGAIFWRPKIMIIYTRICAGSLLCYRPVVHAEGGICRFKPQSEDKFQNLDG